MTREDRSLDGALKAIIGEGSKSFALASALLDREDRRDARRLYAWCRHCDDVIDGQMLGHGMTAMDTAQAEARLSALREQTLCALQTDAPVEPPFEALRRVARAPRPFRVGDMPDAEPLALIEGFAMDVEGRAYRTLDDTLLYAFHVAGVVGAMMAQVMGTSAPCTVQRACDLGIAFQLTNIARDVIDDARNGRLYLPADWLEAEGVAATPAAVADPANREPVARVTARLLDEAERYYASGRAGLPYLRLRSAWAIATARGVYREIGRIVRRRGARAWDARRGASSLHKLVLVARGGLVALASRLPWKEASREGLWTLPATYVPDYETPVKAYPPGFSR